MDNPRISKDYDTYRMFLKSDDINLSEDGGFENIDHKNFEILKQTIALRAVPDGTMSVKKTRSVKEYGSQQFIGNGYVWEFNIEAVDIFLEDGDPVALLKKELDNIVLPCGGIIRTDGDDINIEFIRGSFDAYRGDNTA